MQHQQEIFDWFVSNDATGQLAYHSQQSDGTRQMVSDTRAKENKYAGCKGDRKHLGDKKR